jgi:SAM-dependent methyltransferase
MVRQGRQNAGLYSGELRRTLPLYLQARPEWLGLFVSLVKFSPMETKPSGHKTPPQDVNSSPMPKRVTMALRIYRLLCRLLYTDFAWAYEAVAWAVSAGAWSAWRKTAVPHVRGDCVVELACGTGKLLEHLACDGRLVIGVDRSPQMLAQALQNTTARNGHGPSLVLAAAEALPFASGCVSTVVATFPAEYILAPATHRECARVMQPRTGKLVIAGLWVEPRHPLLRLVPVFYGRPDPDAISGLVTALLQAGFAPAIHTEVSDSAQIGMILADRVQ